MSDAPKLHVYTVALYFGIPTEGAPGGVTSTVWSAYTPGEATAWAMDASHRAAAQDGKILGPFAGHAVMEITEEHLSSLLNSIRTGGKGATVLQALPEARNIQGPDPNPPNPSHLEAYRWPKDPA